MCHTIGYSPVSAHDEYFIHLYSIAILNFLCGGGCSPSVLDRLNALLEPGGSLTINERGVIDGATPSITPHPNFRYFHEYLYQQLGSCELRKSEI